MDPPNENAVNLSALGATLGLQRQIVVRLGGCQGKGGWREKRGSQKKVGRRRDVSGGFGEFVWGATLCFLGTKEGTAKYGKWGGGSRKAVVTGDHGAIDDGGG